RRPGHPAPGWGLLARFREPGGSDHRLRGGVRRRLRSGDRLHGSRAEHGAHAPRGDPGEASALTRSGRGHALARRSRRRLGGPPPHLFPSGLGAGARARRLALAVGRRDPGAVLRGARVRADGAAPAGAGLGGSAAGRGSAALVPRPVPLLPPRALRGPVGAGGHAGSRDVAPPRGGARRRASGRGGGGGDPARISPGAGAIVPGPARPVAHGRPRPGRDHPSPASRVPVRSGARPRGVPPRARRAPGRARAALPRAVLLPGLLAAAGGTAEAAGVAVTPPAPPSALDGRPLDPAIFVGGMPRSGTSLMRAIPAAHPDG